MTALLAPASARASALITPHVVPRTLITPAPAPAPKVVAPSAPAAPQAPSPPAGQTSSGRPSPDGPNPNRDPVVGKRVPWIYDFEVPDPGRIDPGIYLPLLLDIFGIRDPQRMDPAIRDPQGMDPGADPQNPFLIGDQDPINGPIPDGRADGVSGSTTACPKEETPEGEVPLCPS
jgi:hypothetical protein